MRGMGEGEWNQEEDEEKTGKGRRGEEKKNTRGTESRGLLLRRKRWRKKKMGVMHRGSNEVHKWLTEGEFDGVRNTIQGGEDVTDESIREQEVLQPIQSDHWSGFPDQRSASR